MISENYETYEFRWLSLTFVLVLTGGSHMLAQLVRNASTSYGPLAILSIAIAVINGILGCSSVSAYYYSASLVDKFLTSSPGIINMLFVLATVPLASVGAATGFIGMSDNRERRSLAVFGMVVNLLYVLNIIIFSPALIAAGRT
jgi:hypothetical protein